MGPFYNRIIEFDGTKMKFYDLFIDGHMGVYAWNLDNVVFQNVTINSSIGFRHYAVTNTYFINSSIIWNGFNAYPGVRSPATAFYDQSDHSNIILENTTIEGFPEYDFYLRDAIYTDYYLRNTEINLSKIKYSDYTADTRIFEQHLIIINITDQFGIGGACSVRILDNGVFPRKEGLDAKLETHANPTARQFVPTGETGIGEVWLTEKLTIAKSSSPAVVTEYDFSPYNITTRGWGSDNYSNAQLNLTDHNSTIYVDFKITTGIQGEELPVCTITQMLDLNNDSSVDILDAIIVLRKISGLPVSATETSKGCEGINLNPF
jgi:hypothetical protein